MYKESPPKAIWFFSRNFAGRKGEAWHIQSAEKKKTYNQEYFTEQDGHSELEREGISQT